MHIIFLLDILHKLYKGIVINFVDWLIKSIKKNYNPK